jgi:hypothetical protein
MVPSTKNRRIQKCKYKLNISVKIYSFCSQTKRYNQCPVGGRFLEFLRDDGKASSFRRVLLTVHTNVMFGGKAQNSNVFRALSVTKWTNFKVQALVGLNRRKFTQTD